MYIKSEIELKMDEMDKNNMFFVYCGSLYSPSKCIIEEPTILVDINLLNVGVSEEIDYVTVLRCGNKASVEKRYNSMLDKARARGDMNSLDSLQLINFNTFESLLGVEDIAYIFNRLLNFSDWSTRFFTAMRNEATFKSWLVREKEIIPINVLIE